MITLVVKKGAETFAKHNFTKEKITIGSQTSSDIVLGLDGVSEHHAYIKRANGGYVIIDVSSLGTRVNGEQVSKASLLTGDRIDIEPFTVEVETIASPATSKAGIRRPRRWDEPFDLEMTEEDVEKVMFFEPFSSIDESKFPASAPLREILKNDARIVHLSNGDIVAREGDYVNTAFFIIEGSMQVILDKLPPSLLGRREPKRKSFIGALSQLWSNPTQPEARDLKSYELDTRIGQRMELGDEQRVFIQDTSAIIRDHETARLTAGEFFGEIAALGRTPRTASVIADGTVVLLEIRWQGLRDIRKYAAEIKEHIDKLYRERSLEIHLKETPMFAHLSDEQLQEVADNTVFETFGNFDWYASYKKLAERSALTRLENEPIIVREGDYPNGLLLIRSGFARVSVQHNHGHRTVRYLGRGGFFGFDELAHNWRSEETVPLQHSLRAVGYIDTLLVPTPIIEKYVLPTLPEKKLPALIKTESGPSGTRKKKLSLLKSRVEEGLDPGLLEYLVENRYINGTATMMIDLDRCTRCDDCVRACASAHDNNPRFIRHGHRYGNFMIANACMHCADPVCMIGCPTGAIHRNAAGGQVVINDVTCIGCSTCANSCPYNNIRMVNVRDGSGDPVFNAESGEPIVKATKCDLCADQITGPACQRACPHDALKRVDMRDIETLGKWTKR